MDALMGAGGKRERAIAARTGMTPPAKAASPNHHGGSGEPNIYIESEAVGPMEDLRMDETDPPQWSAGEDDEELHEEASESGTSQAATTEEAEPGPSGTKRSLAAQYEQEDNNHDKAKRRREDSRIYAIHLYPREPMKVKGKNIPPIAATEAMAMELVTVWGEQPKILKGGAEPTRHRNVFCVGLNEEDLASRMCLLYAREKGASINITHAPPKGDNRQETVIPYFCAQELRPPTGFREESITLEILASADYVISDKDIMGALKDIKLETIGRIYRPSMGKSCPIQSNKRIIHVVPPGHNPKGGGKWTLIEAARMYDWPRYLRVQMIFEDGGPQPAPIYLKYNIYADGTNKDLGLCKVCHKKEGHANDCELGSKTVDTVDEYTSKLLSMAKTTKDAHAMDKPCKWYLFGLCKFKNKCKMVHDKGVPAHMIGCALPKAKKHTLLKLGLPKNAIVCAGGGPERANGVCTLTRSGDRN